jgi:uncharacterized repeat protein (TIGR03803 family)
VERPRLPPTNRWSGRWVSSTCTAPVIQDAAGNLYDTTVGGGNYGGGTIYKVAADGSGFAVLHDFDATHDGANPYAGLLQDSDGNLYGTTASITGGGITGLGTVYKIDPAGTFSLLHCFTANVTGKNPTGTMNPSRMMNPTGTVTFRDGAKVLGAGALNKGRADYSTRSLSEGTHSITASYGGDTKYAASTSAPLIQTVRRK